MPLRVSRSCPSYPAGKTACASASTRDRRSGKASSKAETNISPAMPPTASRWMCGILSGGLMDRHDIGALGNDRDGTIAVSGYALGDRGIDRGDDFDAGDAPLLSVQPFGVQVNPADAHRLQLHLGLPLIDLSQRLCRQRREEAFRSKLDKLCL